MVLFNRTDGSTGPNNAETNTVTTATVTASAIPSSRPVGNVAAIAAGIAVLLGVLLLAAVVAIFVLVGRGKRMERSFREKEQSLLAARQHSPKGNGSYAQSARNADTLQFGAASSEYKSSYAVQRHDLGSCAIAEAQSVPMFEVPGASMPR